MSEASLLIRGGTILTQNKTNDIIEHGAILVENGVITRIGPCWELEHDYAGEILEVAHHLVMPGLINAHTHLPMSLFRGMADDLPLMVWLNEHMFPAEAKFITPETVRMATRLSCAEMLLSGTTCCCDGYFYEDEVAKAVLESGLRGVLAQGVIDFPAPGVPDPALNVETAVSYVRRWSTLDDRLTPSIFCHSPYNCSEKTLMDAKAAARDLGVLFQIHVAETRGEWEQIHAEKAVSPVAYLDQLGILDESTILVHGVHVDERDLDILVQRGCCLTHAPESNMKLASGVAPIPEMLKRGIVCALGTDGSASNNNLDMFSEMDVAAKLHKVMSNDPTVMDAKTVLSMATHQGARAIGLGESIGSLDVGMRADLIVVDMNKPHLVPMYHPHSHLVYSAKGSDVKHVIVDGRLVVENGHLLTMDLKGIINDVSAFSKRLKQTMM